MLRNHGRKNVRNVSISGLTLAAEAITELRNNRKFIVYWYQLADMSKRMPVKTTRTVFTIIDKLLELDGARFTELTEHVDKADSTIHDHLRTLESMGYVCKSGNEYRVGTQVLGLGGRVRNQMKIFQIARPEVQKLAEKSGEHASLMIEENGMGVLLLIIKGENAVDIGAYAGQRLVLPASAPGKAILASLSDSRIDEILEEHGFKAYTENTITDRDELFKEIETIREQGYATDTSEIIDGVRAISVPITSQGDVRGAITVGGPVNRMSGEWFDTELPELLLQSSNLIELNLTHS